MNKEEIEKIEELVSRCENCGQKQELGFCTDCYIDESEMNTIKKFFKNYIQLENEVKENKFKNDILDKRLKHLLQSETIRKYDEKDNTTGKYILDIKEFDKKIENNIKNKTFGQILDEILNSPEVIIFQCSKIIQETEDEAEKIKKENKILKKQIIAQDNEIYDLQGEIRGMKYIIENIKTKEDTK